ncbi:acyl-CoA thioester hydrolase [Micromonospora pattaloongensis]|uniref:Acyl-CoA thioester hydrolase n=1 Tax=Micromonospora pattaloongensis TaxID=405436 RepID=A0A1H3HFE0_9ACTN|nr:thioesterase family protein [Micromonospora pattaloongensis]SDY14187.1 acyl-CoA thioester hydrolase [Micromonospora pattaloongensis]
MTVLTTPVVDHGHIQPIPVHFDDLDAMGIVHNARYAVLFERAVSQYWAARGHSFENGRPTSPDVFHAVREFAITYHAPIRGTGDVLVHFWLERWGSTSAVYRFRFLSPDAATVHADGHRTIVRLDPATLRPAPWTDAARAVAANLLKTPVIRA